MNVAKADLEEGMISVKSILPHEVQMIAHIGGAPCVIAA